MQITVIETPEFLTRSKKLMDEDEKESLISYLSIHPTSGDLIQGTGGARKLRWSKKGCGKRGGNRVIYFYKNDHVPLFLLSIFSKNQKIDLQETEKTELRKVLKQIVDVYEEGIKNVRRQGK